MVNFTTFEKSVLVRLVNEFKDETKCKNLQESVWSAICSRYNKHSDITTVRDDRQLKKCWDNVRCRLKKETHLNTAACKSMITKKGMLNAPASCGSSSDSTITNDDSVAARDVSPTQQASGSWSRVNVSPVDNAKRPLPPTSQPASRVKHQKRGGTSCEAVKNTACMRERSNVEQRVYRYKLKKIRARLVHLKQEHKLKTEIMALQSDLLDKLDQSTSHRTGVSEKFTNL